jgi:acetylornithine deacetylase/succinyl-diaminopimelate desuccinylase-like protein
MLPVDLRRITKGRAAVWLVGAAMVGLAPAIARAQAVEAIGETLLARPEVRAAVESLRAGEPSVIDDQIRLCEIPAPPFGEARRAEAYRRLFVEAGLQNVRIDRAGNVLGERPGRRPRPHLVFSAHLDTVFPLETDVRVRRNGPILTGPGIGDDCRGLAVVLAVARALDRARIVTDGPITFVGTVGEEGLGDLRGVKHLFSTELAGKVDRFVSVDGGGLGVTTVGVGSRRYKVTFRGPGGHSYSDFGVPSPIHALGRAVQAIAGLEVPARPRTTFNVGRIGGGTSVNAIAFEAWMEVDLRSSSREALAVLDRRLQAALDGAVAAEEARWGRPGTLKVEKTLLGDRPAGSTPDAAAIVRASAAVTRALGLPWRPEEGSTDANLPMSLGIEAVTIDGGGAGRATHSLQETFDTTDSWKGTQRALLLAIALASLPQ